MRKSDVSRKAQSWAKHLKPEGKRMANKSERKKAKEDAKSQLEKKLDEALMSELLGRQLRLGSGKGPIERDILKMKRGDASVYDAAGNVVVVLNKFPEEYIDLGEAAEDINARISDTDASYSFDNIENGEFLFTKVANPKRFRRGGLGPLNAEPTPGPAY